jgi:sirohydrochlorin cobaltochelatase
MSSALILFAHGSRDPNWAAPFRDLQARIRRARPNMQVELAFLELMEPALPTVLERMAAAGHARVLLAPIFMAQGAHLRRDLATLVSQSRERHPHLDIVLLPAAGELDTVLEAMSAALIEAADDQKNTARKTS